MIKINLLSLEDRLNSRWEKINKIIVSSAIAIILIQVVFVLSIFISIKYLEIESNTLDKQLENLRLGTNAKEIAVMQNDIKSYRGYLQRVNQIQEEHLCWMKIVESLSQIVPDETRIKKISIKESEDEENSEEQYEIIIKGESRKEDYLKHLLKFENNLKKSEIFELIVEDYLEKNYISSADFEFRALINKNDVITEK
ncbi:MAG: hypothetical protein U9N04_03040 [Patescibacteria group bacterium]|nr:hypothetical protein [Patescibacteria group bacterium]